jgi:hypothetical protein
MIDGKLVFVRVTRGMIDASATYSPCVPITAAPGSVTAIGSSTAPMRQVHDGCQALRTAEQTYSSAALGSAISAARRGASLITFSIRNRLTGPAESSNAAATFVSTAFTPVGRLIDATRSEKLEGNGSSA